MVNDESLELDETVVYGGEADEAPAPNLVEGLDQKSRWLIEAVIARDLVEEGVALAQAQEAQRMGTSVADLLVGKHLISTGDLFELISARDGHALVGSRREMPDWDVILNDIKQPLGDQRRARDVLLLGLASDLAENRQRCFVVTTKERLVSPIHDAAVTRAINGHFDVRGTLLVPDGQFLDMLMSEWTTRTALTGDGNLKDSSALHAEWDKIIERAQAVGASDIHLNAMLGRGEILFRVLGDLEVYSTSYTEKQAINLAQSMYNTMVDKGSTGDGFNPRALQDAVVTRSTATGNLRLRYSGLPVEPSGINVTLRLLPMGVSAKPRRPVEMGFSDDQHEQVERMFARSSGAILIVGTTGSGKTTSLANLLSQKAIDNPGKKLRTIEQPVEIRIAGASQISVVQTGKDNPFPNYLRAVMRSDPDYIMVGETRDDETASLLLQAVRSGHLVASTLHANGAAIAFSRLEGLGVKRSELAEVDILAGIIYQRLIGVLCRRCRISAEEMEKLAPDDLQGVLGRLRKYLSGRPMKGIFFRNHKGCPDCKRRGIEGRTICAEVMLPNAPMLRAIADGDSLKLWELWRSQIDHSRPECMTGRTAFEHALWKMEQGICSPVDVEREFKRLDEPAFAA